MLLRQLMNDGQIGWPQKTVKCVMIRHRNHFSRHPCRYLGRIALVLFNVAWLVAVVPGQCRGVAMMPGASWLGGEACPNPGCASCPQSSGQAQHPSCPMAATSNASMAPGKGQIARTSGHGAREQGKPCDQTPAGHGAKPAFCGSCQYFVRMLPLPVVANIEIPSLDFLGPLSFHCLQNVAQLPFVATYGARDPPPNGLAL